MKPCLAQVCCLEAPFERDVEDFAAAHCPAVEIWLTKLEQFLQTHTVEHAKQLLQDNDLAAPVASFQGGLLTSQGDARSEHWEHFDRRLDLCGQLGVETIVVACDVAAPLAQQDIDRAAHSLGEVAEHAGRHGVRAALEFQARAALGNNAQTAAALVADVGSPHLGICLDAFHYYTGPSKPEDLGLLTRDNLFHVQLCDLADTPRELATDSQRILPGDGDIPLGAIVDCLREIEYAGYVSIELMNPRIWQVGPLSLGEIGVTALRKLLGQAEMGDPE